VGVGSNVRSYDSDKLENRGILFIDAEPDTLVNLNRFFKSYCSCYFANTGLSGLRLINDKKPNVVVCEINLPDISGFDLCREIKFANPAICFIFLSSRNDKLIRMRGLECLADTFIDKNLDDKEIFLRIRNLLPCQCSSRFLADVNLGDVAYQQITPDLKIRLYHVFSHYYSVSKTTKASININQVAKELALSVRSLQRKLQQDTGLSFTQHHLLFRLEEAQELLLQGYSSTEIANRLCFSSSAYFAHCFKKHYKITPRQFKQSQSSEV